MDAADMLGGRYRLVERLGEGGMSVVWRASDEVLDRHVAVKLLSPRFIADQVFRQRIRAEAQAAARLSHPNIAGIFDYGVSHRPGGEQVPYIVMELLSGETLAEVLEDGPLPLGRVLKICAQIASGLAAAHDEGIVHRDVKPANVMITANGTAKVVDFGVAAVVGDLTEQGGVLFGTPAYVAPERLSGGAVVAGTDVYGLGVLLYRMLTGYMPWSADSTTQMLVAHMYVDPDPLPPLTGLPADVIAACEACLLKEPDDRPAAAEVAEILSAAALTVTEDAAPVVRPLKRPGRGPMRHARYATIAAAALAVIVAAAVAAAGVGADDGTQDGAGPGRGPDVPTAGQPNPSPTTGSGVGTPPPGGSGTQPNAVPGGPGGGLPPITGTEGPAGAPPNDPPGTTYNDPTTAKPTQAPDPQWETRSATQYGNTVTVRCKGAVAEITAANPAEGWSVTRLNPGPSDQVNVRFESPGSTPGRVTFKSRCNGGIPRINPDVG